MGRRGHRAAAFNHKYFLHTVSTQDTTSNTDTITFSGASLGKAKSRRIIAALIGIRDNSGSLTLDSVTIAGQAANLRFVSSGGSNMVGAAVAWINASPSVGDTGDIVCTYNAACQNTSLNVIAIYGCGGSESGGTDDAGTTTRDVASLDVSPSAIICAVTGFREGLTVSWSGLMADTDEIRDEQYGPTTDVRVAAAVGRIETENTSGTVTSTYSGTPVQAVLAVEVFI